MNRVVFFLLSVGLIFLTSCWGKGEEDKQAATLQTTTDVDFPDSIQRMQQMHINDTLSWNKTIFHYDILRQPDEQLPMVQDEHHIRYVDNQITLTITKNGANFYNKKFTKNTFLSFLDEDFKQHGILEGLVYDCITPQGLQFAASISDPSQDDWYLPFLVIISKDGSISIKKDQTMDSNATETDKEEDGV